LTTRKRSTPTTSITLKLALRIHEAVLARTAWQRLETKKDLLRVKGMRLWPSLSARRILETELRRLIRLRVQNKRVL